MSSATLPASAESLFQGARAAPAIGAVALVSLLAFEAMAVAAAMPAIAGALDGVALYALAFGGMLATSVLGMVAGGVHVDRHGPLPAAAAGLALFTAGLLLAALAPGMGWLVAGRIVQGLGSGLLGVALYVGMGQVVPPALHPRLFALFAAAWVLPALVGPALAAWLVDAFGWRSVFGLAAAAAPLAAALLLPALSRLPRPAAATPARTAARPRARRVDARIGWAALAAAGALLLHGAGRDVVTPAMLSGIGAGLLAALLAASRLLPRGSLRAAPGLPAVIALRGLLAASFACAEVFLPLLLTQQHGWSLAQAGAILSAGALMWSAGSALQARIADPALRRFALCAALLAVAAGIALLGGPAAAGWPAWLVVPAWMLAGFGIGLAFPMLSVLTLALAPPAAQGRSASALQLSDALVSSAVLAVGGALFAIGGRAGTGFALVFGCAAAAALAGAWVATRALPRRRAGPMPAGA